MSRKVDTSKISYLLDQINTWIDKIDKRIEERLKKSDNESISWLDGARTALFHVSSLIENRFCFENTNKNDNKK